MRKQTPEFIYLKSMLLKDRIRLILLVASIGFAMQLFLSPILGWIFVIMAAVIGAMEGRSNEPKITNLGEWQNVTLEELEKTQQLLTKTTEISDSNTFKTISYVILVFVLLCGMVLFLFVDGASLDQVMQPVISGGPISLPIIADMLILVMVIGLGGSARTWEPPYLRTRLRQLSEILTTAGSNPQLDFQPSLQLAKTDKGMVPMDCKLLVKIKDADPSFIGIQVQVSFNSVQGTSYPYTYCVILAKPEFDLQRKANMIEKPSAGGFVSGLLGLFADANNRRESEFARFHGSLIEVKQENDVDIAVVRQDTSEGSTGYTTTPNQALEVFADAYVLAKSML